MWPFSKKAGQRQPAEISRDGLTARFDPEIRHWIFQCEGIQFWLSDIPFDEHAFAWARETVPVIKRLEIPIRDRVIECLKEWDDVDVQSAELLCVDLDDYAENKAMDLAYIGGDSWGDLEINIIITDGQITDAYGGD